MRWDYSRLVPYVQDVGNMITADVLDYDDNVVIEAELPGFSRDDISINVSEKSVHIHAQREESTKKPENFQGYLSKGRSNTVHRTFEFPYEIDVDHSKAAFENGLLKLSLKKVKSSSPGKSLEIAEEMFKGD